MEFQKEGKVKIGVLGGTFDPVHTGHVLMAEEAMDALDLSEVLFIPAGQPLLKPRQEITGAEHRLEMLKLAIEGKARLSICMLEIERPGPSYTVDTLAELKAQREVDTGIYFIIGWDRLAQLPQWHEPERLLQICYLVAMPRPECPQPDAEALEKELPGFSSRVVWLDKPRVDISASDIRERVAKGRGFEHMVPRLVAEYIKTKKLYLENQGGNR
jgi:nicotinate-nucleotide adenylyltransferase